MKGSSTRPPIELNANHRRSVSITLQLVDKALCEWDDWTKGHVQSGVMYRQQDTISPTQKNELRSKIAKIRQLIARLRDDLQLQSSVIETSQPIVGQASVLWEMLIDLESRSLQAYGKVPEELARYLDPIAKQLAAEMNEISRLFSRPTSDAARS
jgi:hypothetical protein